MTWSSSMWHNHAIDGPCPTDCPLHRSDEVWVATIIDGDDLSVQPCTSKEVAREWGRHRAVVHHLTNRALSAPMVQHRLETSPIEEALDYWWGLHTETEDGEEWGEGDSMLVITRHSVLAEAPSLPVPSHQGN